ncbi:hypothetical protein [Agrobacterium sp. B1(2019)]|uniref:hypothetical protein n=1 Tax=Agrobacterium sp. B1(2019) TaxID=2607032 RepID=UPI0011EED162|nr:hypothetical protein [Agrobacterium sp. B1(2019)]TZG36566.1 hypothetical protein AGR1_03445 [Agrobacterium sp. B1(2019)]
MPIGSKRSKQLAIKMIGAYGMSRWLYVLPGRHLDPLAPQLIERILGLHNEVDFLLKTEHERTTYPLRSHQAVVFAIAQAQKTERRLSGPRLAELLAPLRPPIPTSDDGSEGNVALPSRASFRNYS